MEVNESSGEKAKKTWVGICEIWDETKITRKMSNTKIYVEMSHSQ